VLNPANHTSDHTLEAQRRRRDRPNRGTPEVDAGTSRERDHQAVRAWRRAKRPKNIGVTRLARTPAEHPCSRGDTATRPTVTGPKEIGLPERVSAFNGRALFMLSSNSRRCSSVLTRLLTSFVSHCLHAAVMTRNQLLIEPFSPRVPFLARSHELRPSGRVAHHSKA